VENQSTLPWSLFVFAIMSIMVIASSVVLSQTPQTPDTQGVGHLLPFPVAGYDFTHAGNDGYGEYDLTLYEDAEIVYDPQRGHVLQLGGTGYALSEQADLNLGEGASLCFWMKEGPGCPNLNYLVGQGFGPNHGEYSFYAFKLQKGALWWRVKSINGRTTASYAHKINMNTDISDGMWHHVAITYDAEQGSSITIDGIPQSTGKKSDVFENNVLGLFVGYVNPESYGTMGYLPFIGWFDDIGFYNTALTQAQIHEVMINGLSGYNPDISVSIFPENGAELHKNSLTLEWQAGARSTSHNVYLSQDIAAVATRQSEAFLGSYTSTRVELVDLKWATTYYWHVDAVNEACEGSPWRGHIGRFSTVGTVLIDDFESYDVDHPYRVFETWHDGLSYRVDGEQVYGGNGTGMVVGEYCFEEIILDSENSIIYEGILGSCKVKYEGWTSMALEYDNTEWPDPNNAPPPYPNNAVPSYYSETQRLFDLPMDWTTDGHNDMAYLSLHYLGKALPLSNHEFSGDQHIVTGTGADIWDKADECTFVSIPMLGNGSIAVEVESIENTAEWARAGIMMRENLADTARHVTGVVTASNRAEHLYRQYPKGTTKSRDTGDPNSISLSHWLRLTRQGNYFSAEHSANGQHWESLGPMIYMAMPHEIQIGLVVNSYVDDTTPCKAVFSNLKVNGSTDVTLETLTNIGQKYNDPDHLYVAVQDVNEQNAVIVHPNDPNAVLVDEWTEWRIPLSALEAQGVDLFHIEQLAIGVGDTPAEGEDRKPGGRGKLYVDQICLMAEE